MRRLVFYRWCLALPLALPFLFAILPVRLPDGGLLTQSPAETVFFAWLVFGIPYLFFALGMLVLSCRLSDRRLKTWLLFCPVLMLVFEVPWLLLLFLVVAKSPPPDTTPLGLVGIIAAATVALGYGCVFVAGSFAWLLARMKILLPHADS